MCGTGYDIHLCIKSKWNKNTYIYAWIVIQYYWKDSQDFIDCLREWEEELYFYYYYFLSLGRRTLIVYHFWHFEFRFILIYYLYKYSKIVGMNLPSTSIKAFIKQYWKKEKEKIAPAF